MILYVKNGCPWCQRVLDFAQRHEIVFEQIKNKNDSGVMEELIQRGGKSQYPYFVDTDAKIEMYESQDIIEYLSKKYHVTNDASPVTNPVCVPDLDL